MKKKLRIQMGKSIVGCYANVTYSAYKLQVWHEQKKTFVSYNSN